MTEATIRTDLGGRLRAVLDNFASRARAVKGAALADRNGFPIASTFRSSVDIRVASAMATMAVRASMEVFTNFGFSAFRCTILEGDDAIVFACQLRGGLASLLVVLDPEANLGLVKLEIERVDIEVHEILALAMQGA